MPYRPRAGMKNTMKPDRNTPIAAAVTELARFPESREPPKPTSCGSKVMINDEPYPFTACSSDEGWISPHFSRALIR